MKRETGELDVLEVDADLRNGNVGASFELIVLGSGTSEGIPLVSCLVNGECKVCHSAYNSDVRSKDLRRATSLLVRYSDGPAGPKRNILIDCGKFFWQTALEWFPKYQVSGIDAVVLTHDHNDACYGLDDLRDFSRAQKHPVPVYLRAIDRPIVQNAFPYLFPGYKVGPGGGVSLIDFRDYDPEKTFEPVPGLTFTPLPVVHGSRGCCGFRFGDVSYISDAAQVSEETLKKMHGSRIVFLDALRVAPRHGSHMVMCETVELARSLRPPPERVVCIGMNHQLGHVDGSEALQRATEGMGIPMELGYDGMIIKMPVAQVPDE